MFWNRKKLTFKNNIAGVAEVAPIVPARSIGRKWISNAQVDFQKIRKQPEYGMHPMIHTVRCPGIFKFIRHGWVMKTWQDITIETNGNGNDFYWTTPIDQKPLNGNDYVANHPSNQYADFFDEWYPNTLRNVIKINSGWTCNVPEGYMLVEMPITHSDDPRFTTITGVFFREQGPAQMNVQLLWHVLNGKELIKAGTPIAQYMLVEKKELEFVCEGIEKASDEQIFFINNCRKFVKNYKEIRDYYSQPSSSK